MFDHIIVGAGSAGCVLAMRLVEAGRRVLLLEAGPSDDILFVRMPATFVRVIGTARGFVYESEPAPQAGRRILYIPQGRMLGGGSSLNAMVYMRGQKEDYDGWAAGGCEGWSFADVLRAFKRAEANERLAGALHGTQGPLRVSDARYRHPLSLAFVRAAQQAGYRYNDDFNGERQEGVGFYQTTTMDGRRASTAATYLAAVRGRPGLTLVTGAEVTRILIEGGRAIGVAWRQKGTSHEALAEREVVVCAGALATPKLMMLSGIGPAAALASLGITLLHDAPEMGANYQDHLEVPVYGRARRPLSLLGQDRGLRALRHGVEWLGLRSGLLTSNVVESGGFFDTARTGRPDVQFHVLPVLVGDVGREAPAGHGITLNPCLLQPRSRGQLTLRSPDPADTIKLDSGALSAPEDVETLLRGVKLARQILRQPALAALIESEIAPVEGALAGSGEETMPAGSRHREGGNFSVRKPGQGSSPDPARGEVGAGAALRRQSDVRY
ncbi:Choline dehydrogenase [Rhizobiales bacterium GAS113]|nr:Choline dehydrogenase [Rhizobiales bacterium GAS113]